ncbi:MAG: DUF5320 domain-containing protein [Nanoarchaeota archaeon]|nr:DUF5320 domain-containing protein [Nanoarchaeota archaeon]
MPGGDGTGPLGQGSMTGRGAGYCADYNAPGYANPLPGMGIGRGGRGAGRGLGLGFGRGFGWRRMAFAQAAPVASVTPVDRVVPVYPAQAQPTKEQNIQYLENETKALEAEQEALKQELETVKKKLDDVRNQN